MFNTVGDSEASEIGGFRVKKRGQALHLVILRATVLPGVTVKTHAIIAAGSVISKDAEAYMIYVGNPAGAVKERKIRNQ